MCDTCRPALGLLCMTHRGGGKGGGESGWKWGMEEALILYTSEEEGKNAGCEQCGVNWCEQK